MHPIRHLARGLCILCLATLANAQPSAPTLRFIVKLRAPLPAAPQAFASLAARTHLALRASRPIVSRMQLMRVETLLPGEPPQATLARLRSDPQVEFAEVDQRRYPNSAPNDPLFSGQWYLQSAQPSALDALDAWDLTTGSSGVVIAEIDTGVRFDHPDLRNGSANRLLPGYDMIGPDPNGTYDTGNTGLGRNPDASDPGDWISAADLKNPLFATCPIGNSSWHGTRVAGILGAITDNQTGIAGTTWSNWVLPVRALGKCGGYDSDVLAAMGWAAGLPVAGVPDNPYPARILNMSLGATGACPASYQQLIEQLDTMGVLVVVAAGNEGGPVDAPANCAGAVAVAGLRQAGTKVGFSSLGPEVALSAPAGNCVNTGAGEPCLFSLTTTTNTGTTVPATNTYTDEYNTNLGTSFSAPQVAAIAGLMLAVNGNLNAAQLLARLQEGAAKPFPVSLTVPTCHVPAGPTDLQQSECSCTTSVCGAGMANAHGAVLAALRPIAAVTVPATVTAGAAVTLNGAGSAAACGHTITSYQWTVVSPQTNSPQITDASSASASVIAPAAPAAYLLMLTVTDEAGRSDSAQVVLNSGYASSSAPASAGDGACPVAIHFTVQSSAGSGGGTGSTSPSSASGGGGGGALDLATIVGLIAAALARSSRRYSRRCAASSHARCARR
jgi:serine protease